MRFQLYNTDCLDVMGLFLAADSVDSIVTDPPYGLEFMGKDWDRGVPGVHFWEAALDVLKPGGHLLAFASARTYHRIASAIEDAGFEIRDQIMWVYGQGFPKSHNLKGEQEGWGTALKPAHEPIVLARKPFKGSVAKNVALHGTGAINIDGCRLQPTGESRERDGEASSERRYTDVGCTNFAATPGVRGGDPAGRWPANLIHDGSRVVLAAFPDAPGQQGDLKGHSKDRKSKGIFGDMRAARDAVKRVEVETSAARFFYCAKTTSADRHAGLDAPGPQLEHGATLRAAEQLAPKGNHHPTVKPTDLMAYLCRLVTPPGGLVLDPFMGSGSTGKAAMREGFQFIGCELEDEYFAIAQARIAAEAST